jgi:AcrR family transcriptional regulator
MIAGRAKTHVALVNYHFSSKEMLFERDRARAPLVRCVRVALTVCASAGPHGGEHPGRCGLVRHAGQQVRSGLEQLPVLIARLATASDGEVWHQRYFGLIDRDFLTLLGKVSQIKA